MTIVDADGAGDSTSGVLLKSQSSSTWSAGLLGVSYSTEEQSILVWTYHPAQGIVQHGTAISVTLADGDRLRAYARADGVVEVYVNDVLLDTRDVSSWPYASGGGYIGLSTTIGHPVLDDFDGGDVIAEE